MNTKWMPAVAFGLVLAAPFSAIGADDAESPKRVEEKDRQASRLAARYNVPEQEINDLRAKGRGWGEINNALAISRKADVPLSDVLKLRDSGLGWGKIAQNYGFKLGEAVGKGHEMGSKGQETRHEDRRRERHQGGARAPRGR